MSKRGAQKRLTFRFATMNKANEFGEKCMKAGLRVIVCLDRTIDTPKPTAEVFARSKAAVKRKLSDD